MSQQPEESAPPPGRAYVPEDRRPTDSFPDIFVNDQTVWMKKPKAGGGYERGWFGPMVIVAAQLKDTSWEYRLRFHESAADVLYEKGAWIPQKDLKTSSEAPSQEP